MGDQCGRFDDSDDISACWNLLLKESGRVSQSVTILLQCHKPHKQYEIYLFDHIQVISRQLEWKRQAVIQSKLYSLTCYSSSNKILYSDIETSNMIAYIVNNILLLRDIHDTLDTIYNMLLKHKHIHQLTIQTIQTIQTNTSNNKTVCNTLKSIYVC